MPENVKENVFGKNCDTKSDLANAGKSIELENEL